MNASMSTGPALIDARWIGIGGPGRVAEHMLQGLHELEPAGEWVVWGPDADRPAAVARRDARPEQASSQGALQPARVSRSEGVAPARRVLRASPPTCVAYRAGRGHDRARHDPVPLPAVARARAVDAAVHRVDGASLDAGGHRLRVLEAEPAGRPGSRSRSHHGAHAGHRSRRRRARAGVACGHTTRRARDLRRPGRTPQEPRPARHRLRRERVRGERRRAHPRGRRRTGGRSAPHPRGRARRPGRAARRRAATRARGDARLGDDARAAVARRGVRAPGRGGDGRRHPGRDQHRARAARDHPRRARAHVRSPRPRSDRARDRRGGRRTRCRTRARVAPTDRLRRARCSRPWTAPKRSIPASSVYLS